VPRIAASLVRGIAVSSRTRNSPIDVVQRHTNKESAA
jgi:hypothetical protein